MNIFDFAMKMEKDGENYYRELAAKNKIQGLEKILNMLADDEVVHYNVLKKLKEGTGVDLPGTEVLKNAKNVFSELKPTAESYDGSIIEFYNKAIEIEKQSEDFYKEKANEVDQPEVEDILLKIAEEERKHQFLLKNAVDFLTEPKNWIECAEFNRLDDYY
jgi:rubrerythrin